MLFYLKNIPIKTFLFSIQELFKSVIPQHCIGCIWSRRDKNENSVKATSVKATVNQFNAVSHRVTSTILVGGSKGSPDLVGRAKRIEAWIEIAQVRNNSAMFVVRIFDVII